MKTRLHVKNRIFREPIIVLQVLELVFLHDNDTCCGEFVEHWRDATINDIEVCNDYNQKGDYGMVGDKRIVLAK